MVRNRHIELFERKQSIKHDRALFSRPWVSLIGTSSDPADLFSNEPSRRNCASTTRFFFGRYPFTRRANYRPILLESRDRFARFCRALNRYESRRAICRFLPRIRVSAEHRRYAGN